jgi:activator of HSP90 ATPase
MVEKSQNVGAAGVGSTWNQGNWHWESRNYNNFAKDYLTKVLCEIEVVTENAKINIYEIKTLTGTAEVAVRKGKQIFQFEYEGELYWKAAHTTDER